jgi:hypothetical protein
MDGNSEVFMDKFSWTIKNSVSSQMYMIHINAMLHFQDIAKNKQLKLIRTLNVWFTGRSSALYYHIILNVILFRWKYA